MALLCQNPRPGAAQSLLSPAWARAGLTAAQGTKGGKLQRHFMSVSEMAGRIHTFPSHPLQKLPAPGKHQLTEIRPERDKRTEMKSLATKQTWLLHRDPALGPNNSLRKGLQAKGNFQPKEILPVEVSREEPAPPDHCAGEPECVPAPVLWKPRKMKPFLLLRN